LNGSINEEKSNEIEPLDIVEAWTVTASPVGEEQRDQND
jgi:hypothetical protein